MEQAEQTMITYTMEEFEQKMQEVLEKHEVTRNLIDELKQQKNCNKTYSGVGKYVFEATDDFLTTLEKYELDKLPAVKNNIKRILKNTNLPKFYAMVDILQREEVDIPVASFFDTSSAFLLNFDVKATQDAIKIMKRQNYDYKNMILKCKELTVNPHLNLLKSFETLVNENATFDNEDTPKAIAENVPSIFTKASITEIPKILKALSNSTYTTIRKNKYSKKGVVVKEKLYEPIDRVLLSNGDILSMEDASEIEKLNQFLKDNNINLVSIFSKNTSIYRRAKYDTYAPAYELAINLRAGNDATKRATIQEEINNIIVDNPNWLVSITEESVRRGYAQSNALCDWNTEYADVYHVANPKLSMKSYLCDLTQLLPVLEYVYGDKARAKEKILTDPKVKRIASASAFERVFKELENSEKYAGNRDELVERVDANIDKVTKKQMAYFLCPEEAIVKDKRARYTKTKNTLNLDATNVKVYNLTTKAKTSALTVDCNNLSKGMKVFFKNMLLNTSQADENAIVEDMIAYIASKKELVTKVNEKASIKKVTVDDLAKHLANKKNANSVEPSSNEEDQTEVSDNVIVG